MKKAPLRYAGLSNERLGGWGVCGVAFRSAKQSACELFVPAVLIPFFACPYLDRIGGLGAGQIMSDLANDYEKLADRSSQ